MKNILGMLRNSIFCDKTVADGPDMTEAEKKLSEEFVRLRGDMGDFDYCQIIEKMEPENRQSGLERLAKIQFNNFDQLMTQYSDDLECASQEVDSLKKQLEEAEKKAILQKDLLEHYEVLSAFMNRTNKRSQHLDVNLHNLEKRIGSWQCLIDEMKNIPDGSIEVEDVYF